MTNTNHTELTKNSDKSFVLHLSLPAADIKTAYQKIKNGVASNIEVKGFRKGKAPTDLIDQQISPEKLLEETAQQLIPKIYEDKIKQYELKPIIQPQIKILNPPINTEKDWELEISACELPALSLDDFQAEISTANKQNVDKTKEVRINQILDILLSKTHVTLPAILIDAEVNYKLSHLVDQANQAGISVQTYLKSQNTTLEDYKKTLAVQVEREWKLNLAIDQVAHHAHLEVTHEEVDRELAKYTTQNIDHNFLHFILLQNKTLEYLQSL